MEKLTSTKQMFKIVFPSLTIAVVFLLLTGFLVHNPSSVQLRVIVLLDETDSFPYWDDAKQHIYQIIDNLNSGDEFELIAIDDKGYQTEDVRIPFEKIDQSFLKARQQKNRIIGKVKVLARRKNKYKATDILGSLRYAASDSKGYNTRIICFSDMEQYPPPKTNNEIKLEFSQDTKAYFIVNSVGEEDWNRKVSIWKPIIERSGLQFTSEGPHANFIAYTNSNIRLPEILKEWR